MTRIETSSASAKRLFFARNSERKRMIRINLVHRIARCCFAVLGVCCLTTLAHADEIYTETFDDSDAGFVEMLFNPGASDNAENSGPWTWGPTGVAGTNAWSIVGGNGGSNPYEQLLNSPEITVTGDGPVLMEFDHAFQFEEDWDGGVVMISINDSPLEPLTNFVSNGYNDEMQTGSDWGYEGSMNGLPMFSIDSGGFIHSVADLGILSAGDTIELQFRAGWDWAVLGAPAGEPQWIIDNLSLVQNLVPGDFNFDDTVDSADLDILTSNFNGPGGFAAGDMNFDGMVSMADFVDWYGIFTSEGVAAVPEPTSQTAMLIGLGLLLLRRRA